MNRTTITSAAGKLLWATIALLVSSQLIHGLNNSDIIALHKAGIGADTLVVAINSADEKDFDVSALSLIELKEAGVDESVIQAMLLIDGGSQPEQPVVEAEAPPVVEEKSTMASLLESLAEEAPEEVEEPLQVVAPREVTLDSIPEQQEEPVQQPAKELEFPKIKTPPQPISRPAPLYPKQLREEGVTGSVVVRFTVSTSGDVKNIGVVESDHELFTQAALQALKQWKFKPAMEDGIPVDTTVKLPIPFNIRAEESQSNRAPQVISRPSPVYPTQLRKKGVDGSVRVQFVVNSSGDVQNIQVLASDHELFTEEALKVLGKWKFSPALQDGQPIDARVQVTIPFKVLSEE